MTARDKLEEAEYFLGKMRKIQCDQKEFVYNLSAFLSAVRSVPDYLLEDYNTKYYLQIPLAHELYPRTFEEKAKQTGNQTAISFIKWWRQKKGALMSDPIGSLLSDKRDIDIHRKHIRPDLTKIEVSITMTARIVRRVLGGEVIQARKSPEQPPPKPRKVINCFFSEYDKEPVIPVCGKYLQMMKDFVEEAEINFP